MPDKDVGYLADMPLRTSLRRPEVAYQKVIHVFGGLYVWEFLISWDFDWGFICRKQRFRWPLVRPPSLWIFAQSAEHPAKAIYFGGRYMMLGYIAALCVPKGILRWCIHDSHDRLASVDVSPRLDCQSLMAFLAVAADTSVGFASLNLALRA